MCQRFHCIIVALMLSLLWPHETTAQSLDSAQPTSDCDSTVQDVRDPRLFRVAPLGIDGQPELEKALPASAASPEFHFICLTDSFVVRSMFTEFSRNGEHLSLAHWCMQRQVSVGDWTLQELHDRSSTRGFSAKRGDTLRFFRSVYCYDRLTEDMEHQRFSQGVTWSYSVWVVDAHTGERLQQLDTMMLQYDATTGAACGYIPLPVAAMVETVVTKPMTDRSVCIRMFLMCSGTAVERIDRWDDLGIQRSQTTLGSSGWQDYIKATEDLRRCTPPE